MEQGKVRWQACQIWNTWSETHRNSYILRERFHLRQRTQPVALKARAPVMMIASHFQAVTRFVIRAWPLFCIYCHRFVFAINTWSHAVVHSLGTRCSRLVLGALFRGERRTVRLHLRNTLVTLDWEACELKTKLIRIEHVKHKYNHKHSNGIATSVKINIRRMKAVTSYVVHTRN